MSRRTLNWRGGSDKAHTLSPRLTPRKPAGVDVIPIEIQRKTAAGAIHKDGIAQRSADHRWKHPVIRLAFRRYLKLKNAA